MKNEMGIESGGLKHVDGPGSGLKAGNKCGGKESAVCGWAGQGIPSALDPTSRKTEDTMEQPEERRAWQSHPEEPGKLDMFRPI